MATDRAKLEKEFLSADKLWKLWRIALTDLRLAERDKNCRIDMKVWFERSSPRAKHCVVCAAGSVLRRRGDVVGVTSFHPNHDFKFGDKLKAINNLRDGFVGYALEEVDFPVPESFDMSQYNYIPIAEYGENKKQFWKDARRLLKYLKENNL